MKENLKKEIKKAKKLRKLCLKLAVRVAKNNHNYDPISLAFDFEEHLNLTFKTYSDYFEQFGIKRK
jgi:hypothetical protein